MDFVNTYGATALAGFSLGASLIIALGAQNVFVLRHGLKDHHIAAVVGVCIVIDVALISAGVAGFGALVSRFPDVLTIASLLGAAFLFVYGAVSFRSAFRPAIAVDVPDPTLERSLKATIIATLAVSLLNPHVYLDTVVLIGSVASTYGAARWVFASGAWLASTLWFSLLGFGSRLMAPLFSNPKAWRVLDFLIALVMWAIAWALVNGVTRG